MEETSEIIISIEEDNTLPGMRFHPTDQELVDFYLKRKVENRPAKLDLIKVLDVYKFEPWDLPSVMDQPVDKEWYFFCRRGRKYKNSVRPNRVTGAGFWKATGIDKQIFDAASACVGLKKSLVYYRGSAGKGTKTDWMMHEFRLPASQDEAEVWTLCRIIKREVSTKKYVSRISKMISTQSDKDPASRKTGYACNIAIDCGHRGEFNIFNCLLETSRSGCSSSSSFRA